MPCFPDDIGADRFVREYPASVVAADGRARRAASPPLFLLGIPGAGEDYRARVRRVVNALQDPLHGEPGQGAGKRVPYARLAAEDGEALLGREAGRALASDVPRHLTPDRFPQFALLAEVVDFLLEPPEAGARGLARTLRDHAYERRADRGGLPGVLRWLGGRDPIPVPGLAGALLTMFWRPLTLSFPRWCWSVRKTRQLVRPMRIAVRRRRKWLGAELHAAQGRQGVFEALAALAEVHAEKLRQPAGHASREEALRALERLLVRALLEDIRVPSAGNVLPKRRRRTARPVLLVELPEPGTDAARSAERFLVACHEAGGVTAGPGPLVIAVGRPSAELLAALGNPEECSLPRAAAFLREAAEQRDGEPVVVPLAEEPFGRAGLPVIKAQPRQFRLGWRTSTAMCVALTVAVAGAIGRPFVPAPQESDCAGGGVQGRSTHRTAPLPLDPAQWYDEALAKIRAQNRVAEAYAKDRPVRTVVLFVSNRPRNPLETRFDGTIPTLRGVAMWQQRQNHDAQNADALVPLRVEVRPTGEGFAGAAAAARKLVGELGDDTGRGAAGDVIGVLGFTHSKDSTRKALEVLSRHGVPVVGTTSTADAMLDGGRTSNVTYWPFTPLGSTESRIEAGFARRFPIVAQPGAGDVCTSARHAVVVQTPGDLYSKSLADGFRARFGPGAQVIDFAQDGDFRGAVPGDPRADTPGELVSLVCSALRSRTVLYWSARARDFMAFVDALDRESLCTDRPLTVLSGNELTNVALTGVFDSKPWLRLYHSEHRLPAGSPLASPQERSFLTAYDAFVPGPKRRDPWRDDGHAAVAYDAFHALSDAVSGARNGDEVSRADVLAQLRRGDVFSGATGFVRYAPGLNLPPRDGTLVLERQSAGEGPVTVVACGAYRKGERYTAQGPPCAP